MPEKTVKTAKTPRTYPNRKRKIDVSKVVQLAEQGVIASDIAKQQGVHVSAITRYLNSIDAVRTDGRRYSGNKIDALVQSQLHAATVADAVLRNWSKHDDINLLTPDVRLQKEILVAVEGVKTYDHNQERLERGQATSITDVRSLILELDAAEARALSMLPAKQAIIEVASHAEK